MYELRAAVQKLKLKWEKASALKTNWVDGNSLDIMFVVVRFNNIYTTKIGSKLNI